MQRTTIYIDESTVLSIRRLAGLRKVPQAELIRQALQEFVEKAEQELERKLPPGIGNYRSGRSDVSARADELLRKEARRQK